jgi:[acyl-carrier-protein] S-malonyltransferase
MPLAFLFPGQNSRYPDMLEKLLAWDPRNHAWMERASEVLKRDLCAHYKASNSGIFAHNRDVQIGVFLANHMHCQNLERVGIRAGYSAGLSLGEYNHLVHIGALEFDDALRILAARGEAYERGPRGKMTAVFPVEADDIRQVVLSLHCSERLGVGMINTPRQCVLSGDAEAVDRAARVAEEEFLAEAVVIEERLPMHSPLFRTVGDQLRPALEQACWHVPGSPYLPNLTGQFEKMPAGAVFVDVLSRHTWNAVRWRDCIETLVAESSGTMTFVETGPKSVLTNFFGRKWANPDRFHTDTEINFESALEKLIKEISNGFAGVAADL